MNNKLIKCEVTVSTTWGQHAPYKGMFKSTVDATLDALKRFEAPCTVKVVAVK